MFTKEEFSRLAEQWKTETLNLSSMAQIVKHPAYQAIIGVGAEALPFILESLRVEADHWFYALHAITGEDPVPYESRGYIDKAAEAWVAWGIQKGIIKQ